MSRKGELNHGGTEKGREEGEHGEKGKGHRELDFPRSLISLLKLLHLPPSWLRVSLPPWFSFTGR